DFFSLLGVKPLVGRTFLPEEHQPGGPRAVMLSEGLWRNRFGANPSIVGQGITLNGQSVTVAGVLPERFNFPPECDVWTSLVLDTRRNNAYHRAMARHKPGATHEQAQAEMDTIAQRIAQSLPAAAPGKRISPVSLHVEVLRVNRTVLFI